MRYDLRKLNGHIIGLLCLALVGVWLAVSAYAERRYIEGALATGRLAPLPASAHAIRADTEGNLFARTFWVVFQAPEQDIEQWLRRSPALAGNPPASYPLPMPGGEQPDWFQPASIRNGRLYQIRQDRYANYGSVWIDLERNIVYVKASHS